MMPRSYNQYCSLAHALDLVGDRWALLIVRDLVLGPKRFTDLAHGLPGIGSNILTARLKELETANIVQRRVLPPPAASTVYELTSYGADLYDALAALAQWGSRSLGMLRPGQIISQNSLMLGIHAIFHLLLGQDVPQKYQVIVEAGESSYDFRVEIGSDRVLIEQGIAQKQDITLQMDVATLYLVAGGELSMAEARQTGVVHIIGSSENISRFLEHSG